MGKTDLSAIKDLDDLNEPQQQQEVQKPKMREQKKQDTQDKVVSTQIMLAFILLASVLVMKYVLPDLYESLYKQYLDFISKPPIWDLDGAHSFASISIILQWFG